MTILRGVDGCPGGWLAATCERATTIASFAVYPSAAAMFAVPAAVTTVDIPIGLPAAETRVVDTVARRMLGPRASSVFPTPVRATLATSSYETACDVSAEACGKRLSKQAYAILPKIAEIDAALQGSIELRERVFEVHPEVCFTVWNDGKPMLHPKASGFGFAERLRLAESVFGDAAERARSQFPRTDVSDDDILDALAALWTARRIAGNCAVRLSESDHRDATGLPMTMWA